LNVAIYSPGKNRWTMTERSARSSHRSTNEFVIGPSSLRWEKDCLTIEIKERAVPFGQAVRGTVRVYPEQLFNFSTALDDQGRHRWGPLAPRARVQVDLSKPDLHWQGNGYLDSNEGDGPIAPDFHEWDWSRAELSNKRTAVIYDVRQKNGLEKLHALLFHPDGRIEPFNPPPRQNLPQTAWRIQRQMRNADQPSLKLIQTLEDTPFYARSILSSELLGESVISFHETLNVPRFASPIVQWMLAWRMPRVR
jgi:carotenoid 1,2-hydratase